MKVLICCDSEIVLQLTGMALEAAGHQVVLDREPVAPRRRERGRRRAPRGRGAREAGARPAARARLRGAARCSRPTATREELARLAHELKLDGVRRAHPPDDLAKRFTAALEARRRVLIVDDSEIVARLLREELEAKGFEIQYAPDAEKATSIILKRQTRPDLILLDINMPKVDGGQFCRFVKKNEMFKSIKVIFCSGEDKEKMKKLVAECGADGFISKDEFLGKWIVDNG